METISIAADEPLWTVNFKRALAGQLQLQIDAKSAIFSQRLPISYYSDNAIYHVMEVDPLFYWHLSLNIDFPDFMKILKNITIETYFGRIGWFQRWMSNLVPNQPLGGRAVGRRPDAITGAAALCRRHRLRDREKPGPRPMPVTGRLQLRQQRLSAL